LAGGSGGDFGAFREVTLVLLRGGNPYALGTIPYPLPALLVIAPFTWFRPTIGAALFVACGVWALLYGILRVRGWAGLTVLASPAFFLGWFYLQWSPLIVAGALVPWLGGLGVAKPNVAVAPFLFRPRWEPLVVSAALLALSFVLVPSWLGDWLHDIPQQRTTHTAPLLWPFGAIGLLGLLRWREPEGRLLIGMTLSPLNPQIYDHLGLWLVPKGWRESLALSACAWVGFLAFIASAPHDLTRDPRPAQLAVALGAYAPATLILLAGRLNRRAPRDRTPDAAE
jgi:hypothetical protein